MHWRHRKRRHPTHACRRDGGDGGELTTYGLGTMQVMYWVLMVELSANILTKASQPAWSGRGPVGRWGDMMWVVMAWVSEVVQALVVGSCSRMRMTPILSDVPAAAYQACCAA